MKEIVAFSFFARFFKSFLYRYKLALLWLSSRISEENDDDEEKKCELIATLFINVALINFKAGFFAVATEKALEALVYTKEKKKIVKARLYAARGCRGKRNYEEALKHIKEGMKAGGHPLLLQERATILEEMKVSKEAEEETLRKMSRAVLGGGGDAENEREEKDEIDY